MTTVYERLKALQITLPDVQPPVVDGYVASFVPFVRTGNLVYLSGRLAKKDGKLLCGKVGEQIERIVKLLVLVNSTPNFTEQHVVANGASELFLEIFGERGAHARSSFGVAQIPFGACVEIELIAEVIERGDAPKGA
jgi:hypothetical protein